MNCKIINLVICIVTIPLFCHSQTILFYNEIDSEANETIIEPDQIDFHCKISNTTKSLHLNYTELKYLPSNFIDYQVPINCINLEGNQLTYIPKLFFEKFPNLTFLNIANNYISTYDLFRIEPCEKLETLIMDDNSKNEYQYKSNLENYNRFPNLKQLYLRSNQIKSLGQALRFYNFPKLTHLYLSRNTEKTGSLQDSVVNIPKFLLYLEIEDNGICRFNGTIFKNITQLHIGGNQFFSLGSSLQYNSYLNIKNMTNLKILTATRCDMRKINNDAFDGVKNLEKLNLSINFIDEIIDNTFKKLTTLKIISMSYNRLKKIPKEMSLKNLKQLFLNYNFIDTIEKNSLDNSHNLEKLYLRGNRIKTIEINSFQNLVKLTNLDLRENEIHTFYINWASNLKNLHNLNLINNNISSIEFLYLENSFLKNVFFNSGQL
ncbi:uncharacterized protein LOC127289229, partial [Leptopilina boulardi]|uniref:uncharacterized protein LOC127289229 n=1 Tax=Leptopilina boulardi TaxID=63433 RepID=UPI0021F6296D